MSNCKLCDGGNVVIWKTGFPMHLTIDDLWLRWWEQCKNNYCVTDDLVDGEIDKKLDEYLLDVEALAE